MQIVQQRRWDPLVRLTHWGVAAGVLANGMFTEEGSSPHQWVGYAIAALLSLRWIWGLVGSPEARFSAFPPSLSRAAAHARAIVRGERTAHPSHNPLGALMAYALWATLAVVIGSGIAMSGLLSVSTSPMQAASTAQQSPLAPTRHDEALVFQEDEEEGEDGIGEGGEGAELLEEVHEVAANLLFGLAGLHLLGVALETSRSGRGVLTAMLPGGRRRRRPA